MNCDFCNKSFSTKGNLIAHQKSAKYCLSLQGKENNDFECEFCKKTFTVQKVLNEHLYACKEKKKMDELESATKYNESVKTVKKLEKENERLKKQNDMIQNQNSIYTEKIREKDIYVADLKNTISKLEQKLDEQKKEYEAKLEKFENTVISVAEASKTPTITYNTNSNNGNINNNQILNLSPEVVEPILREKLTFDIAKQGQKGLASFVLNNMLKGPNGELKYKCKDTARQNFEYINKNGDVEKDVRAKKLSQALVDGGVEKIAGEVSSKEWRDDGEKYERYGEKVTEIVMLSTDDSTFRNTLTALTS